jgi:hypothetical protein
MLRGMRIPLLTGTVAVLSLACASNRAAAPAPAAKAEAELAAAPAEALPFIENDYPRALAEARAKGLPIFADAWAPW